MLLHFTTSTWHLFVVETFLHRTLKKRSQMNYRFSSTRERERERGCIFNSCTSPLCVSSVENGQEFGRKNISHSMILRMTWAHIDWMNEGWAQTECVLSKLCSSFFIDCLFLSFFVFVLHLFSFAFCFSRHHHPHTFVKNNFHSPSVLSVWVIMMPWTVMVITKVRIFSSLLFFPKTYYAKKDIKTSTQHLHC